MEIRYKKIISLGFIAFGVISALLSFSQDNNSLLKIGLSILLIFYGMLTLTKPYFIIKDDALIIIAILGPAKKTYSIDSDHKMEIDNNTIYLMQNGNHEKLPISKWMVENQDWQLLIQSINKGRTFS